MAVIQLIFLALLTGRISCGKGTLTFVIDDTLSLVDDIKQVKDAGHAIANMVTKEKPGEIEDYVLVTFNHKDTTFRKKTKDHKEFAQAIDAIKVHSNDKDSCSEKALTGIIQALKESQDGSLIYVFTDASAKDFNQAEEVKSLCQEKKSQIFFIVSGHCGDMSSQRYQVYRNVAEACKGQAITIDKNDVTQVTKYLEEILNGDLTVIESTTVPANRWGEIKFTIDDLTKDPIITASGIDVELAVGNQQHNLKKRKRLAWTKNFKAFEPSRLRNGVYTAKVKGISVIDFMVLAKTKFTFEYGFSTEKDTSLDAAYPQPFTDIKTHLLIFVKDPEGSAKVQRVELHDEQGNVSRALDHVRDNTYATEKFNSSGPFRITVIVTATKSGKTVRRSLKTLVVPMQPRSVEQLQVKRGEPFDVHCRVPGNNTLSQITWYSKKTDADDFSVVKGQINEVLHIKKATTNDYYKCVTRTTEGYKQYNGKIAIRVRPQFTNPSIFITPKLGNPVTIDCKIYEGSPQPDIRWQFKAENSAQYRPIPHIGDTLNITSVSRGQAGTYLCIANNTVGSDLKTTRISVQEVPEIEKHLHYKTIKEGVSIELQCRILKGTPRPVITWYAKQQDESVYEEISGENSEVYKIVNATTSRSYKCEAKNSAGNDSYTILINVPAHPEFLYNSTIVKVKEGTPVTINCMLSKGSQPLKKSWESKLAGWSGFVAMPRPDKDQLNIRAVTLSDAKVYKCIAENDEGRAEKITELIVQAEPVIAYSTPIKSALENETVILECRLKKGFPVPTITWFYKRTDSSEFVNIPKDGQILQLQNVQVKDRGHYKCVVKNEIGQVEKIVQLVVNAKPRIVFIPPNRPQNFVIEGDAAVRLPCVAVGYPAPTIKWLVDDKIVGQGKGVTSKCLQAKDAGPCQAVYARWYFDSASKRCRQFNYGGCKGNENRFESEEVCQTECEISTPAAPVTPRTVPGKCLQAKDAGPCQAVYSRWYYDSTAKQCRQFNYGGCKGNENRFESEEVCQTECEISTPSAPVTPRTGKCLQAKDAGPCQAVYPRWYYDSTAKQCRQFNYGGCNGNENRFESEEVCQTECEISTPPASVTPRTVPGKCLQAKDAGPCQAVYSRWYYDSTAKQCRQFNYGGCNGNENRFESEEVCQTECEISTPPAPVTPRTDKCQLPKDSGPCQGAYPKWYFDSKFKVCVQFNYGGCLGNDNRFGNKTECQNACHPLATMRKEHVYVEDNALIIQYPKEADSSKYHSYVCIASNEVGNFSQTYEVVASDHLEFDIQNETYGEFYKPYEIQCPLSYKDPSSVKWYKNSKIIRDKNGPVFHIDSPSEIDDGIYTCRVSDLTSSGSYTVQVKFGWPPRRDQTWFDIEWDGDEDLMGCYSFEYPEGKYEWSYNGKQLDWNKENLLIDNWGEYKCRVSNPLGSLEIVFKVRTRGGDCRVPETLFTSKHSPLVLDGSPDPIRNTSWPTLSSVRGYFIIPKQKTLQLICQGEKNSVTTNSFKNFPSLKSVNVKCYAEDSFSFNGNVMNISDFMCKEVVAPDVERTGKDCLGENTQLVNVGFAVNKFTEVYKSCYDTKRFITLYTKLNTIDVGRIESDDNSAMKESCVDDTKCCYEPIPLVNENDVSFGPAQKATVLSTTLNTVNFCKLKNNSDWNLIETISRSGIPYTVWTGVAQYRRVSTYGGTIEAPKYLWKVLRHNSSSDVETVAIIYENTEQPGPPICDKQQCGKNIVLPVLEISDPRPRAYCCSFEDFKTALNLDDKIFE